MNGIVAWIERTMFLERLAGVFVYVMVTVMIYLFVRNARDHRAVCRTLNVALVLLGIMAFFFVPDESKDLYRWLNIAEDWKGMPLTDFTSSHLITSLTPVAYLMIYLSVNTGFSGVLPLICAVIFYGNIFHIVKDISKRFHVSNTMLSLSVLFFMSAGAFLEVISGVRCFVALSIVARCMYDDVVAGKNFLWRLPFYAVACLTHSSAIPIFLIRLAFYFFFENKNNLFQTLIRIVVLVAIVAVIAMYGQALILNMFDKADEYLFGEDNYSYFWEYLIGVIQWFTMVYTMYFLRGEYDDAPKNMKQLRKLLIAFLAINFVFIIEYNLFHRFLVVSAVLFIPYLACIQYQNISKYRALRQRVFWLSMLIFGIVCVRGNLCGYKFFLL